MSKLTLLLKEQSQRLGQRFSTGVLQEFLKYATPDYLVRGTDLFPLDCQIKNDNSQHNNSCPVWVNQNYTYFLSDWQNNVFWCAAEFQ